MTEQKRYIEFDSTRRNRNEWPEPAEFDLIIAQTGTKDKMTALDPVCLSMPIKNWTSNYFDDDGGGASTTVDIDITASTLDTLVVLDSGAGVSLQDTDGYYIGAIIYLTGSQSTTTRRIVSYKYAGATGTTRKAIITLDSALPSLNLIGTNYVIVDPTDVSNVNNPLVFVPDGATGNNAYNGLYLYNENNNDYRVINFYDSITHLVGVDATTAVGWASTDVFSIRSSLPSIVATINTATTTTVDLTPPATVGTLSSTTDFYKGFFIRFRADNTARRIIAYNATTATFTFTPAVSATPSGVIEILPFSYDNFNPFAYTGSQVSQQQEVCYELELLDLILPNQTLDSENGGRIAFYPYVYVELRNESSSSAKSTNILYSNNPNATRMLWRVAIDDISNQTSSPFIKNDCDGSVQTVKFKPNDNLHFSVRLPSGELFKTELEEFYSPNAPNPLIQISGLFSMRRI